MRRIYIALITIITAATGATAQEKQAAQLSLQNCIDYAMVHGASAKNTQLDILIQQAQNNQTLALAMPKVSAKAEFDDFIRPQSSFLNAKIFGGPDAITAVALSVPYAASVGVSASQIIFDGSVLVALQARKMSLQLAEQNSKTVKDNIKYNISKAYYVLAVAYKQREILAKSLVTGRSMLHELDVTYQNGLVEKIDLERSSVQINNLQNDSATLENGIKLYEYSLKFQMGMDINAPIFLTDTSMEQHTTTSAALLLEGDNYERVPEYQILNTVKTLNEYNVRRYKLAALPSLVAFGAYGTNYGSDKFNDMFKFKKYESNSTAGLQLNIPIFSGFQRVNQVREAKLNVEKTNNNIENLKLNIDFMASQARGSLKNSLLQLQSQKRNLELADDVVDLAQKKYKAGVGSNLEVTSAQSEQLKALNSYISTLLNIINAEVDLKKALGLL